MHSFIEILLNIFLKLPLGLNGMGAGDLPTRDVTITEPDPALDPSFWTSFNFVDSGS